MRKSIIVLFAAAFAVFGFAATSIASTSASGSFKDGPYTGTSMDSSTCGGNWAVDLYVRNFKVTLPANPDGSYTVKESFSKGHFSTLKGQSPGACNTGVDNGSTVKSGVSGTFSGSESGTVVGTFNPNGTCDLDASGLCTTSGWITGFFGSGASLNVTPFKFIYNSTDGSLVQNHWVNADATQGGNSGDIANS